MVELFSCCLTHSKMRSAERKFQKTSNPVEFPDHVLENIFSYLPTTDMLSVCTLVCRRWNDVIKNEKFLLWKKLYLRLRREDVKTSTYIAKLCQLEWIDIPPDLHPYHSFKFVPIMSLIRLMSSWRQISVAGAEQTLKALEKHELYELACDVVRERVDEFQMDKKFTGSHCWTVAATILCLSTTPSLIRSLRHCLVEVHCPSVVMDFFYLAAAAAWHYHKHEDISPEFHYRVYNDIVSIENAMLPRPIDGLEVLDSIKLTHEQIKAVSHIYNVGEVVKIIGSAGTGKTVTIARTMKANATLKFLFTSFEKDVVDRARKAFVGISNVECRTLYSLAYDALDMAKHRRKLSSKALQIAELQKKCQRLKIKLNDKHLLFLLSRTLNRFLESNSSSICLSHVPALQPQANSPNSLEVSLKQKKNVVRVATKLWQKIANLRQITWKMNEDCYLKQWQLSLPTIVGYDVIILGDAEDCMDCIMDVLMRQISHCSLVFVGDSCQRMFNFKDSSDPLVSIRASHSYYLTQSFRFGYDIAVVADTVSRIFKFKKSRYCEKNQYVDDKTLVGVGQPGTLRGETSPGQVAIICRTNLGVIEQVMASLQAEPDKKVAVVGGIETLRLDLIKDLFVMNESVAGNGDSCAKPYLQKYSSLKQLDDEACENGDDVVQDKIEIVQALGEKVPQAIRALKGLSNLQDADIVVGIVHQAKGFEFDSVVLCEDFAKFLSREGEESALYYDAEEVNLLYLAVTRAKKSLVVSSALATLLTSCQVQFLSLQRSNFSHNSMTCVRCETVLLPTTQFTIYQPRILKMQKEGSLCQKCGALLARGYGLLVGNWKEIYFTYNQSSIIDEWHLNFRCCDWTDPEQRSLVIETD